MVASGPVPAATMTLVLSMVHGGQVPSLKAKAEANDAAKYADESDYPVEADITKDVYWEVDNPDQSTNQGRIFFND